MEPAVAHQEDLLGQPLRPGLRVDADPAAVLGTGIFGTVVRGRQLAIERPVAIKVLHLWFRAVTEQARLFQDEIRAIGRIDHRNVVRIFDAGVTEDGRLYFVMELVTGPTCQELAQAGPLPAARAVELTVQLLHRWTRSTPRATSTPTPGMPARAAWQPAHGRLVRAHWAPAPRPAAARPLSLQSSQSSIPPPPQRRALERRARARFGIRYGCAGC